MDISSTLFLIVNMALCVVLHSVLAFSSSVDGLKQGTGLKQGMTGAPASSATGAVRCKLRGTPRPPAFSMDGDYIIGGVFSIHYYMHTVRHNYTDFPEPLRCTGRLVEWRHKKLRDETPRREMCFIVCLLSTACDILNLLQICIITITLSEQQAHLKILVLLYIDCFVFVKTVSCT